MHKAKSFTATDFQSLYLSGFCKCGKHFTVFVEMPTHALVTDETGATYPLKLAEHCIAICPNCGRLINFGNGSRRKSKPKVLTGRV